MEDELVAPPAHTPEDTTEVDEPDQSKMQGSPPLLKLPGELLLTVADFLDEAETTCFALSCTHLWSLLTPRMARYKSEYRDLKEKVQFRQTIIEIIERDLPSHVSCHHCLNLFEPSKSDPPTILHQGVLMEPDEICDPCANGIIRRADEFEISWDKRYPMLYHISFSDVKQALAEFSLDDCGFMVDSLGHTQVACLDVKGMDFLGEWRTDKHTMLTSVEAMICHYGADNLELGLFLRIQHIMTARSRKVDHTIIDEKELPRMCFHGNLRWRMNKFTREPRSKGGMFRDRTTHLHGSCNKCQIDYSLEIVNDRHTGDGFTLVLTRWINLGPGQSTEDREWKVHSECCPTNETTYIQPQRTFESRSERSFKALLSCNFSYLENNKYQTLMEKSDQHPNVWVLRSPEKDWLYETMMRIRKLDCGFAGGSDDDDGDDPDKTDDSDEEEDSDWPHEPSSDNVEAENEEADEEEADEEDDSDEEEDADYLPHEESSDNGEADEGEADNEDDSDEDEDADDLPHGESSDNGEAENEGEADNEGLE